MTVQLREGSEVRTFANAAAALRDLMEREGSPYVSGVRSADGASITVTDGTGRVATFGLSEFDEDSKVVTSEPILDEGGCPIKLGDEVRIGAYRYHVTEFGTSASVMLEPLNGGTMRQFPASLVLVVKRAKTAAYGPDQTNIGRSIRDHQGRTFEIEDESLDGRYVVILTGHGDSQIDLEEGYPVFD